MCLIVPVRPVKQLGKRLLPDSQFVFRHPLGLAFSVHSLTVLVFVCAYLLFSQFAEFNLLRLLPIYSLVVLSLSVVCRLPIWWWWFNALMPWLIALMLATQVPSEVFLVAFILSWLFYTGINRTRVPYYPSHPQVLATLKNWLPPQVTRIVDMGSGFGGCCFALQDVRPGLEVTGVEMAVFPWLISCFRAWWRGDKSHFLRQDYRTVDLAQFDVVYAYLSPVVMEAVWQQALSQMNAEAWLVSLEFDVLSQPGHRMVVGPGVPDVYVWRMGDYQSAHE